MDEARRDPADRSFSGVNLELDKQNEQRLKDIVAGLQDKAQLVGEERKLHDLYAAFEDQKQIDANGMKPAQADLAMLANLKTLDDVARAMGTPSLSLTDRSAAAFKSIRRTRAYMRCISDNPASACRTATTI